MRSDASLGEIFSFKERPTGISILAVLHIVGGIGLLAVQAVMLTKYDEMAAAMNQVGIPPMLLMLGVLLLGLLGFASGIGMWRCARWGWWCVAFYYVYGVARNANAIYAVSVMAEQVQNEPRGPGYYYFKHGGRVVVHLLILLYLFKPNVLEYFGLGGIPKGKTLLKLVAATAVLFVGPTIAVLLQRELSVGDEARLRAIDERINQGDYEVALQQAHQYVKDYPQSALGLVALGWAAAKSDQLDLAEDSFRHSLTLDPAYDNAYVGLGVVFRKRGDLDQSRSAYLKALEILPENAEALSSLVTIELMEGNDQKAVEYGEQAWALRTDLPSIAANLAIAYHYAGNTQKRDEFFRQAERLGYHGLQDLVDIFEGRASIR